MQPFEAPAAAMDASDEAKLSAFRDALLQGLGLAGPLLFIDPAAGEHPPSLPRTRATMRMCTSPAHLEYALQGCGLPCGRPPSTSVQPLAMLQVQLWPGGAHTLLANRPRL